MGQEHGATTICGPIRRTRRELRNPEIPALQNSKNSVISEFGNSGIPELRLIGFQWNFVVIFVRTDFNGFHFLNREIEHDGFFYPIIYFPIIAVWLGNS